MINKNFTCIDTQKNFLSLRANAENLFRAKLTKLAKLRRKSLYHRFSQLFFHFNFIHRIVLKCNVFKYVPKIGIIISSNTHRINIQAMQVFLQTIKIPVLTIGNWCMYIFTVQAFYYGRHRLWAQFVHSLEITTGILLAYKWSYDVSQWPAGCRLA